jgi:hypothetical protein
VGLRYLYQWVYVMFKQINLRFLGDFVVSLRHSGVQQMSRITIRS